jgi:Flp pilus assembly protein TadG
VAFLSVVLFAVLMLVFDVGRLAVVRSQAQNTADAAAIAGAVHLTGQVGARANAEAVARGAADQISDIQTASGGSEIQIDDVAFYSDEDRTPATGDGDARFVEVSVVPRPVKLLLEPVVALLTGAASDPVTDIGATAMAGTATGICDPPALLICNPGDNGDLNDITRADAAGKMMLLRQAGQAPVAGDYGLLCPPPYLNCGAPVIEDFLASDGTDKCSTTVISTKTGVNFNKVNSGINHRFEDGPLNYPMAPIITDYPRDKTFESEALDMLGDGDWGPAEYWADNYPVGPDGSPPELPSTLVALDAAAVGHVTRFQVYLYELGLDFASNPMTGETIYPAPALTSALSSQGFAMVYAVAPPIVPDDYVGDSGVDALRRIMPAAIVQCEKLGIKGNFNINTYDMEIADVFVTEAVGPPPANNSPIVVEIVRMRSTTTYDSDSIIANVRLVD